MQNNPKPYNKSYGPVKLYYNDIKSIYDELSKHSTKIDIKSESHIFEDWEDLVANFKDDKSLSFSITKWDGVNAFITIDKERASINMQLSKPDLVAKLYIDIDAILSQAEIKRYSLLSYKFQIFFVLTYLVLWLKPPPIPPKYQIYYEVALIILGIYNFVSFFYNTNKSKIYFIHKSDQKNILQRTKDDIFSNIAASLITALIGFIIGVIATKLGWIPQVK